MCGIQIVFPLNLAQTFKENFMTTPANASVYSQGFGSVPNGTANPVFSTVAPASTNVQYPLGQRWINTVANTEYSLTSFSSSQGVLSATWTQLNGGGGSGVQTINSLSPVAGDIIIAGTANQIGIGNAGHTVTLSLIGPYTPATYTAHGVLIGEGTSSIVATAVGTNGQVLTGNTGADPAFAALGTNSGLTAHGVLLGEGNGAIVATAVGTNGQVLTGNTGADPTFQTPAFTNIPWQVATISGSLAVNNAYLVTAGAPITLTLPVTAAQFSVIKIQGSANTFTIGQNAGQSIVYLASTSTVGVGGSVAATTNHAGITILCTTANTTFIVTDSIGNFTVV